MSGEVLYSSVKFTRKPGDQAAAKLCAGREDDVTYATVKFAEAPSSQQQQQTDPSRTADPTPPVSAAGKASSYRQPALVLLILCCLLLAAIISLAVHHSRTKEDPEKYTSLTTNYSSLLNQLQHNNRLNETHSELQSNCSKLSGSHSELQSNYSRLNETHSELQSNYSKVLQNQRQLLDEKNTLQKVNSELKKNNTELSIRSSIVDKYCPLKEGSSKERVCCPEKWLQFNGKCYYFSNDTMDWNSSRDNCTSMGGHLVIIESEAEQRFLLNEAKAYAGNRYWIGLTDAVTEGAWLWVDGTPLNDKAKFWYGKEPSDDKEGGDSSGQDCADLMYMSDTLKVWFDQSCTQQPNRRICETMAVIINI